MLMAYVSRNCGQLTQKNQALPKQPVEQVRHRHHTLSVDPSRKSASCFLAPVEAFGNAFRWMLEKIYTAKFSDEAKAIFKDFSPVDRRNIVAFLKKKDEILLKVIEDHMATFRDVWPKQQFGSAQAVLKFISPGYTKCFLEQYAHFRKCARDEHQHPEQMAQYIAHHSAIAEVFPHADLHEAALLALTRALDSATGIGAHKPEATEFIKEHRNYYK